MASVYLKITVNRMKNIRQSFGIPPINDNNWLHNLLALENLYHNNIAFLHSNFFNIRNFKRHHFGDNFGLQIVHEL